MGKVKQLEHQYPWVLPGNQPQAATLVEQLDMASLTKAQQAISSEIEMDRLLGKVMRVIMENAGAQYGYLLMEKNNSWIVIAKEKVNHARVEMPYPANVDESNSVSAAVIHFVARTKKKIVLDNAVKHGEFVNDPLLEIGR